VHPSYLREAKSKFLALNLHEIKNGYPMITIFNKAPEMLPPHNWVTHLHHGEYVFEKKWGCLASYKGFLGSSYSYEFID
jgi:hypothetical protein